MNRHELRKAGELAGIRVDKYGYILSDVARKRIAKMAKWKNTKGSKTNYVEKVIKKWNISLSECYLQNTGSENMD